MSKTRLGKPLVHPDLGACSVTTGYLWDQAFLGHVTSTVHPERPERVMRLAPHDILSDMAGVKHLAIDPYLGMPWARRTHGSEYVNMVTSAFGRGQRALDATGETLVREDTSGIALTAASAALTLTRAVATGEVTNGFAAIRPPGHHAGPMNTRGFCYFNNAALCTRFAQSLGHQRILIIDWDVHPGDGTEAFFFEDPDVHLLSLHQDGIFTNQVGLTSQIGRGNGSGTIHNVPLQPHTGELEYLRAFDLALNKAVQSARPDMIFISCGFDAHTADPIGSLELTEHSYAELTRLVCEAAASECNGRVVSMLEGGYNPAILPRCVCTHIEALDRYHKG